MSATQTVLTDTPGMPSFPGCPTPEGPIKPRGPRSPCKRQIKNKHTKTETRYNNNNNKCSPPRLNFCLYAMQLVVQSEQIVHAYCHSKDSIVPFSYHDCFE